MIDGKTARLKIDGREIRGEKVSFKTPDEWAGKKVTLMPYLHSSEDVAVTLSVSNKKPRIIKACWKDAAGEREITEIPPDGNVTLYIETGNIPEGEELGFTVPLCSEKTEF
jgi:hypothetical protein